MAETEPARVRMERAHSVITGAEKNLHIVLIPIESILTRSSEQTVH